MTEIALTDWHAETLRLSAFMVDTIAPTESPQWQELLGTVPDEQRNQPQQQLQTEDGPFLGGRLRVDIRPNRYDWVLYPDQNNRSAEFSSIGSYGSLEDQFRALMLTWLGSSAAMHRLAFAGVFLLPSASVTDVYARLDSFLPAVQIDRANTRDLTYRINRRRKSRCGLDGLEINRVATWSALQIIGTLVDISAGVTLAPKVTQLSHSKDVCRLELDINTNPEFTQEFPRSHIAEIFNELVDCANELILKGDVP